MSIENSIDVLIDLFKMGDPEICGCGQSLKGHDNGMDSGHSPVNYFNYTIDMICKDIATRIAIPQQSVNEIVHRAEQTYEVWGEINARKILEELTQ